MELTRRQKKLLAWIGYPMLAIVTFVIALHVTFPYHRVKGKVIEALSDKYDVSIAEVEPTFFPGGIIFTKIVLQTRPDDPKEKSTTIIIDKLRVDAGILAMIRGRVDLDILAELGAGTISGSVLVTKSGLTTGLSTSNLNLETVPGLKDAVGLPMSGGLNATVALYLPNNKWSKAEGEITLDCPGCTVGDGKTKIKPRKKSKKKGRSRRRRRSFMDPTKGLTVPKLDMGDLSAVIVIKKGVGTIERFSGKSKDGSMKIEGDIRFADPFKRSKLPGCFHFKLSKKLKDREKNFGQIMDFLDVSADKDGWGHMKLVGNLPSLSFKPVKTCKPGVKKRRRTKRPRVTTRRRTVTQRPAGANARNKARKAKAKLKNGKKAAGKIKPKGINNRFKANGVRGKSGPKLRKKGRNKRGDDVKKGIKVDGKGRPNDSARPNDGDDDDDDDDDDNKRSDKRGDDDDDDDDDDGDDKDGRRDKDSSQRID